MTPTARTLKMLRDGGWLAEVVERWNPHSRTRHDLFGFADVLAVSPQGRIVAIQVTSGSNVSARVKKIAGEPRSRVWLAAGGHVQVHGWRKLKRKRGGKAVKWEPVLKELTASDLDHHK